MRKRFFLENLVRILTLSLIPVILITAVFIAVLLPSERNILQEENHNKLALIQENMELLLNDSNKVMNLLNIPSYANSIYQILEADTLDYVSFRTLNQTAAQLNAIVNSRSYIDSIYVYIPNEKGTYLTNTAHIYPLDAAEDPHWLSVCSGASPYRLIRRQASLYEGINSPRDYLTVVQENGKGHVVAVNIVVSYFKRLFQNLNLKQGEVILFVDNGTLLFSSGDTAASEAILQALYARSEALNLTEIDGMLVSRSHSSTTGVDFFSAVPKREIFSSVERLMTLSLAAMGVCILISILLSLRYSINVSRQLYSILDLMDAAISHQTLPTIKNSDNSLYSHIITNMIQTFTQNDFLRVSLSEQKFQAMTLELSALQYQINPHFLSNTLQMIDFEILRMAGRPSAANEMIQQLSRFLQYSLSSPNQDVTVEQETAATRYYTSLMARRHRGQVDFTWQIEDEVLSFPIPKLILQPVIENSIRHGLSGKETVLHIQILAEAYGEDELRILIQDDGKGISPAQLQKLQASLTDFKGFQESHIGLQNLCRRLQLRFSQSGCSVILSSQPGQGFSVDIRIQTGEDATL